MRTRWVTFDCFGTLVDWNSGFTAIMSPVFGKETAAALGAYHNFERELEAEGSFRSYRNVLTTGLERSTQFRSVSSSWTLRF